MSAYDSNTPFKEVTTESEGSTSKYGSNQHREVFRMFNGTVVPSRLVQMANPWRWVDTFEIQSIAAAPDVPSASRIRVFLDAADGKLKLKKSNGTVLSLEEQPGTAAAHKNQHLVGGTDAFVKTNIMAAAARYLEILLADPSSDSGRYWIVGSDVKYWDNQTTPVKQTLERLSMKNAANGYPGLDGTSKITVAQIPTLADSNIATHTSTRISIINKAQLNNQIGYKDETGWLTDAMVSTARISSKTKLNANIGYRDQANDWGAFHQDYGNMTAPANPPAGRRRLYVDAADGRLKVKTSTGTVIDLETTITPPITAVMPDGTAPPSSGKWGAFWGGAYDGTAKMAGVRRYGNWSSTQTSTTSYTKFTSDATDGEQGGFLTELGVTRLDKNPYVKFSFKSGITTERVWIGVHAGNEMEANTDYPLEDIDGVLFGYSDADANFCVLRNNSAASPTLFSTTIPKNASPHTVEMIFTSTNSNLKVNLDGVGLINVNNIVVPGNSATGWNIGGITESVGGTAAEFEMAYMYMTATA
jgi:hypothetical protein